MPTRKTTTKTTKKSAAARKKAAKPAAASVRGPIPPYGVPIREAIARGNPREMQALATATRQYLKNVQSALAKLEGSLGMKR